MSAKKKIIKKVNSDYSKIRVTSNGAFYMRSADIFNNKKESLSLLSKLSKTLERYKSNQEKKEVKIVVNA
jgi:PHD/YefM family antitoxin component YafN of YafNO toxin-antitoxin module